MEALHNVEIAITFLMQSLGAWLAVPMKAISVLGQEEFYLLLLPFLYWSVDAALGLRVGIILLFTQFFNHTVKIGMHSPRPYWVNPRVIPYAAETSFGIPSNHSQAATGIWGLLAFFSQKKWATIGAILVIFLIGLSRLFLGVHFLSDVLTGWLLGGLTLFLFVTVEPGVTAWLKHRTLSQLFGLAAASSVGLILVAMLVFATVPANVVDASWTTNALAAFPDVQIDPLNLDGIFTVGGTWFGMLAGAAWLWKKRGKFDTGGPEHHRLLRFLVGAIGLLILWYGLGKVLPRSQDALSFGLRYARYVLIGVWVSALAPLLFSRLGLARLIENPE